MYTEAYRDKVRSDFIEYLKGKEEVEGALAMGSGAVHYRDILSHIVVAVAMRSKSDKEDMIRSVSAFFESYGKVYIRVDDRYAEGYHVTAFWPGGLSMIVECRETEQLLFGVPEAHCVLLDKTGTFEDRIVIRKERPLSENVQQNEAFDFYYALRRCEMGLIRKEYIMAERQLSDARMILLKLQLVNEGGNPRFQRYDELQAKFREKLDQTYPKERSEEEIRGAVAQMAQLFRSAYLVYSGEPLDEKISYLIDYDTQPDK